jgi:hypothetical protein
MTARASDEMLCLPTWPAVGDRIEPIQSRRSLASHESMPPLKMTGVKVYNGNLESYQHERSALIRLKSRYPRY